METGKAKPCAKASSARISTIAWAITAIFIPPLRDRKKAILPLVDFFIDR